MTECMTHPIGNITILKLNNISHLKEQVCWRPRDLGSRFFFPKKSRNILVGTGERIKFVGKLAFSCSLNPIRIKWSYNGEIIIYL